MRPTDRLRKGRRNPQPSLAYFFAAGTLVLAGCARSGAPAPSGSTDAAPVRSQVERGPVALTVEVAPAAARLSDELTLTLTIASEPGVKIQKPTFGEVFGEFLVRGFRQPLPKVAENREIMQQVYTLEPMTTGELSVAPIAVSFIDDRPSGDHKPHTVESEALTVKIESVVGSALPSLDELGKPADPVELPAPARPGQWAAIGGGAMALLALLALVYRRRRCRAAERMLSPRDWAARELERIVRERLMEHDVKRFYVELTGVVRAYIERTTAIHAPEQTTEEFLREIGSHPAFGVGQRSRLRDFLEAADLVKFAAYEPRENAMQESLRRARLFVGLEQPEEAAA